MNEQTPPSDEASDRTMRRKIVRFWLVFSGLGLLFIAIGLWAGWGFFSRNYVRHLLNQRQYVQALDKVRGLQRSREDSPLLLTLETQALTVMAQYDAAVNVGRRGKQSNDAPHELNYWLALAEYQAGNTSSSQQTAANFLKSEVDLPNGANALAEALAGNRNLTSPPDLLGLPFRLLFPVEQGAWLGFVADEQARSGNHVLAARLYREAFIRGHRNAESLTLAAASAALAGDFDAADIFLDYAGESAQRILMRDLTERRGQSRNMRLRITGSQTAGTGGGQLDVARALAWALSRIGNQLAASAEDPSPVDRLRLLYEEFPRDAVIRIWYAEGLAQSGPHEAALTVLRELHQAEPTLETWIRLNAPGDKPAGSAINPETLTAMLAPAALLSGDDVRIISEKPADNEKNGRYIVRASIEIPQTDTYDVTLVMRSAAQTTGLQPFTISMTPEGPWTLCYSRPGHWRLCTLHAQLEAGEYQLQIAGELPFIDVPLTTDALPEIAAILVTSQSRIPAEQ